MQRETELEQKMIQNKEMILARINAQQAKQLTQEEKKQIFQERNQLRIQERMEERECPDECFCAGVTVRCWNQDGMEMTITAGDSGNVIVITKNSNMSTNVTLYHHDGRVFANYNGNRTVILNYLPEDIEEKVRERVNARIQERKIELDEEDGNYTVDIQKRVRFLGLIPMKEKMEMRFNPETGELIKTKTKWWGFLARDVRE